jgi:hypothetical protein
MSTLKLDTIASRDGTESTDVTNVINGSFKNWVLFDGSGTVSIHDSFNTSSITDLGTGVYQVNLSNSYSDTNYAIFMGSFNNNINQWWTNTSNKTTSHYELRYYTGSAYYDLDQNSDGSIQ